MAFGGDCERLRYSPLRGKPCVRSGSFHRDISASEQNAFVCIRIGEQKLEETQRQNTQDLADYENNLKAKVTELEDNLALRRISEEQYYSELKKYLDDNKNLSSKAYFEQLEKYETYIAKKQEAADKAAEDEQKAEKERQDALKKAAEDAETERINTIKSYWDKVTRLREKGDRGEKGGISEAREYQLKAQIVKEYCDENEETWDSYYKWLYDYTKKQEDEIADVRLKSWEDNSKKLADNLSESYKALKSQKEQVKKDLQSIDLTETVTDKEGNEVLVLKNLDAEIKKIDKYEASLKKLEATGISESLMEKINKLSYADGSRQRYIDQLLALSSDKLQLYYSDWERLQAKQESAAQNTVAAELKETNKEAEKAIESVNDMLDGLSGEAYDKGAAVAKNFLQGIIDSMNGLDNADTLSALNLAYGNIDNKKSKVSSTSKAIQVLPLSTPLTININGKSQNFTLEDLVSLGVRTGGNVFNL